MIKIEELTEIQKNKLLALEKCDGFWLGTTGFKHKKTIYTVDFNGTIWKHSYNRGVKFATFTDIQNLFK